MRDTARPAYVRIAGFLANLRINAEQLHPLAKWCRILSEARDISCTDASFSRRCASPRLVTDLRL